MRKNNLEAWKYTSSLNCLLFFAQRMDELLFHHTTDSYRYSALSIRGLASEYCMVYRDAKFGTINKKNLDHIIEEFAYRLKSDDIAKEILSMEYVERFKKIMVHGIRKDSLRICSILQENWEIELIIIVSSNILKN